MRSQRKEGQLETKCELMTRAGREQDKLKGKVKDVTEGREATKKAHGGWISRGPGDGKDRA